MTALKLNPYDNNYLSCRLINQQLSQNKMDFFSLGAGVAEHPSMPPKIVLDGTGRISFEGAFVILDAPTAGMVLATLPDALYPSSDVCMGTAVIRADAAVFNALSLESNNGGIGSITLTNRGTYNTIPNFTGVPTVTVGSPGTGASLQAVMRAKSAATSLSNGGLGFVPGQVLTLSGGTFAPAATFTLNTTKLMSIGAGIVGIISTGTGGTPGAVTLTGTTGTGTKFQLGGTINGSGNLSAVTSIINAGSYTVNPTNPANEPVTGGGLTGCVIAFNMGINTVTVLSPGYYTVVPVSPVTASASGTDGGRLDLLWEVNQVLIHESGNGYDIASPVTFSGGGPDGGDVATGTVVLEIDDRGQLTIVNAPQVNDVICLDNLDFVVEPYL